MTDSLDTPRPGGETALWPGRGLAAAAGILAFAAILTWSPLPAAHVLILSAAGASVGVVGRAGDGRAWLRGVLLGVALGLLLAAPYVAPALLGGLASGAVALVARMMLARSAAAPGALPD